MISNKTIISLLLHSPLLMQSLSNPKSRLKAFGVTSKVALEVLGTGQKVPEKVPINGLNRLLTM